MTNGLGKGDTEVVFQTDLSLPLYGRGKVRDTYDLGDELLIVSTDRISAFDVVLPCAIPLKGKVLNQLSAFWFGKTGGIVSNHMVSTVEDVAMLSARVPGASRLPAYLEGRSMVVRKARLIPVECVVRGYMSGSAWAEYQERGTACGLPLPPRLRESERLPEPVFTPSTKAETGHDTPMTRKELARQVGESLADELETNSKRIYAFAHAYALDKGIIIADTKMEFGKVGDEVILIDELLTPDSSRFWEASRYSAGRGQDSYDKQPVRDWLVRSGWDKSPPAPVLPGEVIEQTTQRYRQAYERLAGKALA